MVVTRSPSDPVLDWTKFMWRKTAVCYATVGLRVICQILACELAAF